MTTAASSSVVPKLILRGSRLALSGALETYVETKMERLFRHEPRILRLRVDVELNRRGATRRFTAKGHIEIRGNDLKARVTTGDAYRSASLLADKLERMLRKRTTAMQSRRFEDDIRAHPGPSARP